MRPKSYTHAKGCSDCKHCILTGTEEFDERFTCNYNKDKFIDEKGKQQERDSSFKVFHFEKTKEYFDWRDENEVDTMHICNNFEKK